jgi:hypothetical protein
MQQTKLQGRVVDKITDRQHVVNSTREARMQLDGSLFELAMRGGFVSRTTAGSCHLTAEPAPHQAVARMAAHLE